MPVLISIQLARKYDSAALSQQTPSTPFRRALFRRRTPPNRPPPHTDRETNGFTQCGAHRETVHESFHKNCTLLFSFLVRYDIAVEIHFRILFSSLRWFLNFATPLNHVFSLSFFVKRRFRQQKLKKKNRCRFTKALPPK